MHSFHFQSVGNIILSLLPSPVSILIRTPDQSPYTAGNTMRGAASADAPVAGGSLSSAGFLGSVGSLDSGMSVSLGGGVCSRSLGPEGCSVDTCGAGVGGRPAMTTSSSLGDIRKAAKRTLPSVSSLGGYGGVVLHMLRRSTKSPVPQGVNI